MRIFLDTEFTGLRQDATLISIGLVAENGDMFYAELTDFDSTQVEEWVKNNVLPCLSVDLSDSEHISENGIHICKGNKNFVSKTFRVWVERFGSKASVEIWADVLAWDWVLFCELFGGAFALPEQLHYIPRDLSTLMVLKGIDPDTPREELGRVTWSHPRLRLAKHHALYDALLEKDIFEKIFY